MAKLFKQAFRQKTHDEGDTAMRGLGATGVFRNMAFQEMAGDVVMTPKGAKSSNHKKGVLTSSNEPAPSCEPADASEPLSPACRDAAPREPVYREATSSSEMWASPPATPAAASAPKRLSHQGPLLTPPTPTGGKRAASSSAGQTPKSHRLSLLKLPRNITEVEEIAVRDINPTDGEISAAREAENEDGGNNGDLTVAAAPWTLTSPTRSCPRTSAVRLWEEEVQRLLLSGRMEEAVRWAAPPDCMIRCTVRRVKNFLGQALAYHLFLDHGDTFVLAARKRKKSANSNYVLSTSQEDLGRDSEHRIAKLRANFVGTEYSLLSRGCGGAATAGRTLLTGAAAGTGAAIPSSQPPSGGVNAGVRPAGSGEDAEETAAPANVSGRQSQQQQDAFAQEELAVHYKQTVLTAKGGPRVMLVATPLPDSIWAPSAADGSDSLASCLEAARRRELTPRLERQLCMLATRPPEWDSAVKAFTLDFHGRVRASSVKNFQLVHWDHNTDRKGSDLVLQFGKMVEGSEDFALDFTYPLTLQKAFGIALASTDAKLCYAL